MKPQVLAVCISSGGIPKLSRAYGEFTFAGLQGDGHNHDKHNTPFQAVSLQDMEILEDLEREGYSLAQGATGENLVVRHLQVNRLPVGTVLEFEGGVVLELTKVRKPCYVLDSIDPRLKEAILGRCGLYAKVIKEGRIYPGARIEGIKVTDTFSLTQRY